MTTQPTTTSAQQFEQLFKRSRRRAYKLAYSLTGNVTEAEDLTQDAYVRAWHHFDRYDSSRSFEGWLFSIMTNRAIDLQRRKKRVLMHSLDMLVQNEKDGRPLSHEFAAPDSDPVAIVLGSMLDEGLDRAMAALSEEYRRIILLCDVEQRSYQEIADTMQCPLGTVRSRIHRGRRLLRRNLM